MSESKKRLQAERDTAIAVAEQLSSLLEEIDILCNKNWTVRLARPADTLKAIDTVLAKLPKQEEAPAVEPRSRPTPRVAQILFAMASLGHGVASDSLRASPRRWK